MKYLTRSMNPISVIVIFAGLSEASATSVLSYLDADSRQIYIWFLIAFPSALVLMFFLTLNFNQKALYAPSEFSKEEQFSKADYGQPQAGHSPQSGEFGGDEVTLPQIKETPPPHNSPYNL